MAQHTPSYLSDNQVIYAWSTPSSHGSTVYETILRANGTLSCDCPAWVFKRGDNRTCKHIRLYRDEADRLLARARNGQLQRRSLSIPGPIAASAMPAEPAADSRDSVAPRPRRRAIIFHD